MGGGLLSPPDLRVTVPAAPADAASAASSDSLRVIRERLKKNKDKKKHDDLFFKSFPDQCLKYYNLPWASSYGHFIAAK